MKLITWNIQWGRGIDLKVDLARIAHGAREIADFDVLCRRRSCEFPVLREAKENQVQERIAGTARLWLAHGIATDVHDGHATAMGSGNLSRANAVISLCHSLHCRPPDSRATAHAIEVVVPAGGVRCG